MAIVNIYNIGMFSKEQREGHDKRHKCSICGKVRYEKNMCPICYNDGRQLKSRYGNGCWCCNTVNCKEKAKRFNIY